MTFGNRLSVTLFSIPTAHPQPLDLQENLGDLGVAVLPQSADDARMGVRMFSVACLQRVSDVVLRSAIDSLDDRSHVLFRMGSGHQVGNGLFQILGPLKMTISVHSRASPASDLYKEIVAHFVYSVNCQMKSIYHYLPGHPLASAWLYVKVGWRHEPPQKRGLSHFLEHVLYLGSRRYPDVDAEAGRYGVHFDGPTLAEATGFGFTCLREDLPHLLEVLLDMVFYPRLKPQAIERERLVVLGAVNQESDYPAWELVRAKVDDLIFETDEVESLGTRESLSRLTAHDLRDWHHRFYHAANAILTVAGDVDEGTIRQAMRAVPAGEERPAMVKVSHASRLYRKAARIATQEMFVGFKFPPPSDPIPLELLQIILGNYPQSRLYRRLRREEPLAYMVESTLRILSDAGRLGLYLGVTKPAQARRAMKTLLELLATLREEGIDAEELAWARRVYRLGLHTQACHPETAASFLGERSLWGEVRDFAWLEERLEEVEPEELGLLAQRIFRKENCCVGFIGPEVEWDPGEFISCLS